MRICITGGCGFVGRRFVAKLLERDDDEIVVVDNLYSGLPPEQWMFKPKFPERLTFVQRDCRTWFRNTKATDFDLVLHLAAIVGGRINIEKDPLAVATDLSIDAEMFNWAVRGDPAFLPRVVYFSSSAVYPLELQRRERNCALSESLLSFKEVTRLPLPDLTYGYAKMTGEYLAKFAREQYGLKVICYRPFGGYGEDQDPETYPFTAIIRRVLRAEDPVAVWGSGDQLRDFIHIDDVVECVLSTMLWNDLDVLNIGTGIGTSFYELADMIRQVTGYKFSITNDVSKPEGVFARVADPYQMHKWFKPTIPLRQGISKVVKAMQEAADYQRIYRTA